MFFFFSIKRSFCFLFLFFCFVIYFLWLAFTSGTIPAIQAIKQTENAGKFSQIKPRDYQTWWSRKKSNRGLKWFTEESRLGCFNFGSIFSTRANAIEEYGGNPVLERIRSACPDDHDWVGDGPWNELPSFHKRKEILSDVESTLSTKSKSQLTSLNIDELEPRHVQIRNSLRQIHAVEVQCLQGNDKDWKNAW